MFPYDGAHIRLAGRMVDPALGVAVGWNHFFAMTSYVIFEATIVRYCASHSPSQTAVPCVEYEIRGWHANMGQINTLVEYWGYNQSPAILITVSLLFYLAINVYRADLFGESECEYPFEIRACGAVR